MCRPAHAGDTLPHIPCPAHPWAGRHTGRPLQVANTQLALTNQPKELTLSEPALLPDCCKTVSVPAWLGRTFVLPFVMLDKLELIKDRFDQVAEELSRPEAMADMKRFSKLNKEYKDLDKVVQKYVSTRPCWPTKTRPTTSPAPRKTLTFWRWPRPSWKTSMGRWRRWRP